ncbi:uncharacterized protein LOC116337335 [Contarinia nasturtii]|uniref:uncharacterized protein LOC116337335 n=1 Tax=Contarinia nasturtii TaxID=265458 RepID=UPI0012D3C795|nr:uncharacterized protein LOC116337335 [Contarinia nasturtii]
MDFFVNIPYWPLALFLCTFFVSAKHVHVDNESTTVLIDAKKFLDISQKTNKANCGENEEYRECGKKCALSCRYPSSSVEITFSEDVCEKSECVTGCFCKDGLVRSGDKCVQITECLHVQMRSDRAIKNSTFSEAFSNWTSGKQKPGKECSGCNRTIHIHNHNYIEPGKPIVLIVNFIGTNVTNASVIAQNMTTSEEETITIDIPSGTEAPPMENTITIEIPLTDPVDEESPTDDITFTIDENNKKGAISTGTESKATTTAAPIKIPTKRPTKLRPTKKSITNNRNTLRSIIPFSIPNQNDEFESEVKPVKQTENQFTQNFYRNLFGSNRIPLYIPVIPFGYNFPSSENIENSHFPNSNEETNN